MSLRQKQILDLLIVGLGLLLVFLWPEGPGLAVGLLVLVAGLILNVVWIRCPECGTWLGKAPGDYCHLCGAKLNWKEKRKRDR